ncbi:MAG: hypothetical protein ACRCVK_08675, partial [Aeromonas veronii]
IDVLDKNDLIIIAARLHPPYRTNVLITGFLCALKRDVMKIPFSGRTRHFQSSINFFFKNR